MELKFLLLHLPCFCIVLSSPDTQLTCTKIAKRPQSIINSFFNCTPSFASDTQTIVCQGTAIFDENLYGIYPRLEFSLLEEIPNSNNDIANISSHCVGLHTFSSTSRSLIDPSPKDLIKFSLKFDSLLAVGVLTTEQGDWNYGSACNISMLNDILQLQLFNLNFLPWIDQDYWNFTSPFFGMKERWFQQLSVQGFDESICMYYLTTLQNSSIQKLNVSGLKFEEVRPIVLRDMPLLNFLALDSSKALLFDSDVFTGTPEVEHLFIHGSHMNSIPTAIARLEKLQNLTYSDYYYSDKFDVPVKELSTLSKLESLCFIHINLFPIAGKLPALPTLKKLILRECQIASVNESDFESLPGLIELDLSGNGLMFFEETTFLHQQNLEFLDLSRNKLKNWLILHNCSLKVLDLSHNYLISFKNLGITGTTVEFLNISNNKIAGWDDLHIFSLKPPSSHSQLKDIEVSYFHKTLDRTKSLGNHKETHNLLKYYLDNHVTSNNHEEPRRELPSLQPNHSLFLVNMFLSNKEDSDRENVVHSEVNSATLWLKKLDLSYNYLITGLSKIMIESCEGLEQLELGGNHFDCANCLMIPFQKWLNTTSTNVTNLGSSNPLLCSSPHINEGSPVVTVLFDEEPCLEKITSIWMLVGVPMGIIFIILSIGSGVIYQFRSELMYVHHLYRIRNRAKNFSKTSYNQYAFDAFVCYSSHDRRFVLTQLTPLLEKDPEHYVLCLHERDFPLGSRIVENIVGSIQHSRKTIIILSEHFIQSKWCKWELEMANHKMFHEDEHFLILIQLERLDRSKLPRHLQFFMDTRTFLEWPLPGHKDEQHVCQRLKAALGPSIFQTTNERAPLLSDIMEEY